MGIEAYCNHIFNDEDSTWKKKVTLKLNKTQLC